MGCKSITALSPVVTEEKRENCMGLFESKTRSQSFSRNKDSCLRRQQLRFLAAVNHRSAPLRSPVRL